MAKRRREPTPSTETNYYEYKNVEFEITIQPMAPLGPQRKTWAAKVTRSKTINPPWNGVYANTVEEADDRARKAMEARIDPRKQL